MNNGYGGMPSRRRLRGPLHPPHRAPPTSSTTKTNHDDPYQDCTKPLTGQKRGWASTNRSFANGSAPPPWEQPAPTSTTAAISTSASHPPQSDFVFHSGLSMPFHPRSESSSGSSSRNGGASRAHRYNDGHSSNGHGHDESSGTAPRLPRDESSQSLSGASAVSASSFRTATELEPQVAAHGTISSRGMPSAQQVLMQEQRKTSTIESRPIDEHYEGPPSKRRRGFAGTIVDTALNAALYTGAAALTAYSLWSAWGRRADQEQEPDGGPVVSAHKTSHEEQMPPGSLEEPPPPYIDHDLAAGPSVSKSPSQVRKQRVFVSAQRNRRRPTFQSHRASQATGTPRKLVPDASRGSMRTPTSAAEPTPSAAGRDQPRTDGADCGDITSMDRPTGEEGQGEQEEDEEDEDSVFRRFQDKMNALIAEGQAALNSTPTLDAVDFDQDDPGFSDSAISGSISAPSLSTYHLGFAPGIGRSSSGGGSSSSPFTSHTAALSGKSSAQQSGMAHSQSQPFSLHSHGSPAYLPEPVKRSTPTRNSPRIGSSGRFDLAGRASGIATGFEQEQAQGLFGSSLTSSQRPSSPFTRHAEDGAASGRFPTPRGSTAAWQSPTASSTAGNNSFGHSTSSRRTSMLPRPSTSHQSRRATGYAPR
ncbi:hypothetical protein ACQY0O_006140 [Thecaphora frezii]